MLPVHAGSRNLFIAQYLRGCGLEENTDFPTVVGFQIIPHLFIIFLFIVWTCYKENAICKTNILYSLLITKVQLTFKFIFASHV